MSNENPYIERVAKLEEKLDSAFKVLNKLDAKLDAWNANYVPRQEINEMLRARDKEIDDIKQDLDKLRDDLRNDKRANKGLLPAWAAVGVSIIALIATVWLALGLRG